MAEKRVITFSSIAEFFRDNSAQLQRGENSYSSGNVSKMIFDGNVQPALLRGQVEASMKKRKYDVEVSFDTDDGIVAAKCSCPRGQVICHHMAALCLFGHHNVSVTDQACAWNVSKANKDLAVQTSKDMFPPKRRDYCAVGRRATADEIDSFQKSLQQPVGFKWLLQKEPTEDENLVPAIENILFSEEFLAALDKRAYILQRTQLNVQAIEHIAATTVGQVNNEVWLISRKHRLTASQFGKILAACQRGKYPPSLYKSLTEGYDLDNVKAIQWGRSNEASAISAFSNATGLQVTPTGLWLHESGVLGASPDGLVNTDAIIEVKCPFKYRNSSLSEALKNDKKYIIFKDDDENVKVNANHEYWHQIQGQLHLTNKKMCYLVIWTPGEVFSVPIEKEETWKENIAKLINFYFNKFVPYLGGIDC